MSKLEEKIDNINLHVSSTVKKEVSQMKQQTVKEITEQVMDNISKEVRSEVKEIDETKK